MIFGLQNEREWATFCTEVLGDAALALDPRFSSNSLRVLNRPALTQLIETSFGSTGTADVVARLDAAGIANGRMNSIEDVWNHPQLKARGRWRNVGSSAGPIAALLPPANITDVAAVMGDVPALGEHTDAILSGLGFDAAKIAELRAAGAI